LIEIPLPLTVDPNDFIMHTEVAEEGAVYVLRVELKRFIEGGKTKKVAIGGVAAAGPRADP